MSKLRIWGTILTLGGICCLCSQTAVHLSEDAQHTLTSRSPIELRLECHFAGDSYEALKTPDLTLPPADPKDGPSHSLSDFSNPKLELSRLTVQAPEFIDCAVTSADPMGFHGLAPPTLWIKIVASPAHNQSPCCGSWTIRLMGKAHLTQAYFNAQRWHMADEIAQAKDQEARQRIRDRLADLTLKAAIMDKALPVEGRGQLTVNSVSNVRGLGGRWLSKTLWAIGVVFGTLCAACSWLYLKHLKEGDIEP